MYRASFMTSFIVNPYWIPNLPFRSYPDTARANSKMPIDRSVPLMVNGPLRLGTPPFGSFLAEWWILQATLDLRQVDFTGQEARVTAEIEFGQLRVILPDEVDTTVVMEVTAGEARAFGTSWSGFERPSQEVTDLGTDGPGGGTLRLYLQVKAGDAEVVR